MRSVLLPALGAALLLPAVAAAHMTLGADEPAAGSSWKAMLYVPHGCEAQDRVAAAGQGPHDLSHPASLLRTADAGNGHDTLAGSAGPGGTASLGDLTIERAMARASIGNAPTSAAYMTITTSGEPDRLIAAASPAAQAVEMHTTLDQVGVMQMQRVESIPVAPDAPAQLAPGGLHIMLIGLAAPLEEGTTVPLTLTFETAGEVTVDLAVRKDIAGHMH